MEKRSRNTLIIIIIIIIIIIKSVPEIHWHAAGTLTYFWR